MKYRLFLLSLLAGPAFTAAAQTAQPMPDSVAATRPSFVLGYTQGLVSSSFLGSDANTQNAGYRLALQGGLTVEMPLTKNFMFRSELLYAQKGSRYSSEQDSRNQYLTYLELPLLLRGYTSEPGTKALFLEFGPRVSALLAAHDNNTRNTKSSLNPVDVGFLLGFGFRTANNLAVGLRYDVGITPIYREIPAAASQGRGDFQPNTRNDAFFLSVSFPLWNHQAAPN